MAGLDKTQVDWEGWFVEAGEIETGNLKLET
jgi:hypothetical protein